MASSARFQSNPNLTSTNTSNTGEQQYSSPAAAKSNVVSSHVNIYCANSSSQSNQTSSSSSSSSKSPRSRSPPPVLVTGIAPGSSGGGGGVGSGVGSGTRTSVIRLNRGPSQPVSLSYVETATTTGSLDRNRVSASNRHSQIYQPTCAPDAVTSPAATASSAYQSECTPVDICSSSYCCQINSRNQYTN